MLLKSSMAILVIHYFFPFLVIKKQEWKRNQNLISFPTPIMIESETSIDASDSSLNPYYLIVPSSLPTFS